MENDAKDMLLHLFLMNVSNMFWFMGEKGLVQCWHKSEMIAVLLYNKAAIMNAVATVTMLNWIDTYVFITET